MQLTNLEMLILLASTQLAQMYHLVLLRTVGVCRLGRGVNMEGFNFKLAMVKTCSNWPLLNKYAL